MHKLGIHHMTALETDPLDFVSLAAETGCLEISVFTQQPGSSSRFPLLTRENLPGMRVRLLDTGVFVANVDAFIIAPETDVTAFMPALELGAELGARGAVTIVYDPEESRVVDTLGALCDLAEPLALKIALEFVAFTPAWNTLPAAVDLVTRIAHPNLAIDVDVLHLAITTDYGQEAAGNGFVANWHVYTEVLYIIVSKFSFMDNV